jgi:hypothetical protein
VARRNPPALFDPVEESFDQVAGTAGIIAKVGEQLRSRLQAR